MNIPDLIRLVSDFYAERLALLTRHEAGARRVSQYDFNNTYQYIINREEQHLQWLQALLRDLGAPVPASATAPAVPGDGIRGDVSRTVSADDARLVGELVARWRPRIEGVTNARVRNVLRVILGESLEHQRFFEAAADGNEELLGRRTGGVPRVGAVLSTRWLGD